jgi:hypothetical protein
VSGLKTAEFQLGPFDQFDEGQQQGYPCALAGTRTEKGELALIESRKHAERCRHASGHGREMPHDGSPFSASRSMCCRTNAIRAWPTRSPG